MGLGLGVFDIALDCSFIGRDLCCLSYCWRCILLGGYAQHQEICSIEFLDHRLVSTFFQLATLLLACIELYACTNFNQVDFGWQLDCHNINQFLRSTIDPERNQSLERRLCA